MSDGKRLASGATQTSPATYQKVSDEYWDAVKNNSVLSLEFNGSQISDAVANAFVVGPASLAMELLVDETFHVQLHFYDPDDPDKKSINVACEAYVVKGGSHDGR